MQDNATYGTLQALITTTTAATVRSAWLDLTRKSNRNPLDVIVRLIAGSAVGSDVTVDVYVEHSVDGSEGAGTAGVTVARAQNKQTPITITNGVAMTPTALVIPVTTDLRYIRLVHVVAGGSTSRSIQLEGVIDTAASLQA